MTAQTPLSAEEQIEIELGEQARINADDWSGAVAPGKAKNFGQSFGRLIGLLKPHAFAFILVSILGAIGVVLTVWAPKVLGEATNIIFAGVIGQQLPAGSKTEQAVQGLRDAGHDSHPNVVA
ncbi:MAG: ABC transporter ATP-binding protein, partial [Agromyces sp.]